MAEPSSPPPEVVGSENVTPEEVPSSPEPPSFPPYPPYAVEPAPPTLADTIMAGRDIRVFHKAGLPRKPVRPAPRPARPRGPKATDVTLTKRATRAHARCLRRHNAVLTDRLEHMSKPHKRKIICLWREHGDMLPADTIARLRTMLDADEPFKPDQAYEYFINLKKTKRMTQAMRINEIKKDVVAMCADKRFVWARNATVAFARGIQQRLSRPGRYALADGMLRLSNIILNEICGYMHMRPPSRRCTHPKAKFMMEMADKVAIWIDEILSESDDRMLMMDFDEDEDVLNADEYGDAEGFADDFLDMMGGAGGHGRARQPPARPASDKFTGEMAVAFKTLTEEMYKKGNTSLINHGKFKQTYREAADELKKAEDFNLIATNQALAQQLNKDLTNTVISATPPKLAPTMQKMLEMGSNYLAQQAEFNKDKGAAFNLLVKQMKAKGNEPLYQKDKTKRTYEQAARELEGAKNGLETTHDDPNLSQEICAKLAQTVDKVTSPDMKAEMKEAVDLSSKFLSESAVNEGIRAAGGVVTDEGFYIDEHGVKRKINPEDAADDFYVDENGIRRKKKPGEETYVDAQGIRRKGKSPGPGGMAAPVTEEGFYVDENGVKRKINPEDAADDFYIDEHGIRRKKKPGEETYVDAQGVRRKGKSHGPGGMAAPVTEEGFYVDENGVKRKINPEDAADDFYVDENGIRRKKKPGEETYVDAQGIRRKGKPPGTGGMAAPVTEEGFYVDENGVKKKINPGEAAEDFYIDENGIRRKKKPGEETYIDAQGIRRKGKPPGSAAAGGAVFPGAMGASVTEEGYYVDEQGVKRKIGPGEAGDDFYVDENGIRRKKKPGEETYVDAQGVRRKGKPPGAAAAGGVGAGAPAVGGVGAGAPAAGGVGAGAPAGVGVGAGAPATGGVGAGAPAGGGVGAGAPAAGGVGAGAPAGGGIGAEVPPGGGVGAGAPAAGGVGAGAPPGGGVGAGAPAAGGIGAGAPAGGGVGEGAPAGGGVGAGAAAVGGVGAGAPAAGSVAAGAPAAGSVAAGAPAAGSVAARAPAAGGVGRGGPGARVGGVAGPAAKDRPIEEGYYIDENGNKKKIKPGDNPDDYYIDAQGNRRKKITGAGDKEYTDEHGVKRKTKGGTRKDVDGSSGDEMETDPDRAAALDVLHNELRKKGDAMLYKQPHTELSYSQASKWLKQKPRMKVDKTVKESADTARLHKKFERKLNDLISKKVPTNLQDAMQDFIIESSRILSEYFVAKNYKALVTDALISEMQKKGNEILVEVGDDSETFFFAAQRLKKAKSLEANEPCDRISYFLAKQLDDMIRSRSMARKVVTTMKEHIKDAAEYLSEHVTKPDEQIEAYVALLGEMESTGDALLIEGNIPKSYKSCAAYLRNLTSYEDQINRPNASLKSSTESKLSSIMANVVPHGYTSSVLKNVISQSAGLLVSYIMLQGEKTEALKILIDKLTAAGPVVLLRHGTIRKTYTDGADMLRGKNADQLSVSSADPVVARKIQLKLISLMRDRAPDKHDALMNDVIEDATMYLANYLLQPRMIKVCKCMKNVFVQCELWCDEILRRVARPCCTCSRHVSAQALAELAPGNALHFAPGSTRAFAPGLEVEVTECPSGSRAAGRARAPCPAPHPTPGCNTASYMVYSASCQRRYTHPSSPTRLDSLAGSLRAPPTLAASPDPMTYVAMYSTSFERRRIVRTPTWLGSSPSDSATPASSTERCHSPQRKRTPPNCEVDAAAVVLRADTDSISDAVRSSNGTAECEELCWHMPPSMFGEASYSRSPSSRTFPVSSSFPRSSSLPHSPSYPRSPSLPSSPSIFRRSTFECSPSTGTTTRRHSPPRSEYGAHAVPTISTDQMSDWHAMMVSLMWNVQAWRDWIQENIDRALAYQPDPSETRDESDENWANFQRRVSTEALQWRQYNLFSQQLTLRLASRYRDKHIVSPTRATNRTETYMECQQEMLEIIEMFNRWTQWLSVVVKETNSLSEPETEVPLHELRWQNFKMKVQEYSEDWDKYNLHLKVCWEQKYRTLIAEWLPAWNKPGPVWVVSACGAVPSGAVAAGLYDSEVVWVARTTHRCNVLPAALHPSKHCCIVYADGAVHHYTKYQVMCNAEAVWLPWRAGAVGARAVRVAPGVYAGRVLYRGAHLLGAVHAPHYRCHVVIFGRPFAFNCYELLVLPDDE